MKCNLILATMLTAVGISAAGLAANAGTTTAGNGGMTEEQMFRAAKVKLDQASQIALKEAPGNPLGDRLQRRDRQGRLGGRGSRRRWQRLHRQD